MSPPKSKCRCGDVPNLNAVDTLTPVPYRKARLTHLSGSIHRSSRSRFVTVLHTERREHRRRTCCDNPRLCRHLLRLRDRTTTGWRLDAVRYGCCLECKGTAFYISTGFDIDARTLDVDNLRATIAHRSSGIHHGGRYIPLLPLRCRPRRAHRGQLTEGRTRGSSRCPTPRGRSIDHTSWSTSEPSPLR